MPDYKNDNLSTDSNSRQELTRKLQELMNHMKVIHDAIQSVCIP